MKNLFVNESQLINKDNDGENHSRPLENLPQMPVSGVQHHECSGVLADEIVDAVRGLMVQHPKHQALILEMFGNPDGEDFAIPSYISVSEAAKASGTNYSRARVFFSKVVRPFFKEQFAGC